jgi:hypothetical protein
MKEPMILTEKLDQLSQLGAEQRIKATQIIQYANEGFDQNAAWQSHPIREIEMI